MTTSPARQNWVLAAAIVLAALILGVSFGGRSAAQKADPPAAAGRYQSFRQGNDNTQVVVIDTATGQCWLKSAVGADWTDLGSPAKK
jgi:hypothetical protein